MGALNRFMTGGSKSKSSSSSVSENQAYDFIKDAFSGQAEQGADSNDFISRLLGMGGDPSVQNEAFDTFRNNTGYQFLQDEGAKATNANMYSRGLGNSGAALTALQDRSQGIADQSYNSFLDRLFGMNKSALDAGSLIGQAGQKSTSSSIGKSSSSNGGFMDWGPQMASGFAASDRRLKTDVIKVGELDNGLNVYEYNYINGSGPHIGVMADEVEALLPEALGPVVDGYATVNYDKIDKTEVR